MSDFLTWWLGLGVVGAWVTAIAANDKAKRANDRIDKLDRQEAQEHP